MSNLTNRTGISPFPDLDPTRKWVRNDRLVTVTPTPAKIDAQPPLDEYFNSLFTALGPQHWWPGKTPFEVIIGAILTQNTSWKNVELALANLRAADVFTPAKVEMVNLRRLQSLIRPAGYFRQKARALKAFVQIFAQRAPRLVEENVCDADHFASREAAECVGHRAGDG